MTNYKIGIIGYFAHGKSKAGGQEAKTWSIYEALSRIEGKDVILTVDTTDWKKNPFKLFWGLIRMVATCNNVIMLPAQKSIKVFIPIAQATNVFFQHKLFYSVVGGWLPKYLEGFPILEKKAKRLDGIFVETISMKENLDKMGFSNIEVIPNFKNIIPIDVNELCTNVSQPIKLCTFSRIMKEKGIEDIVKATQEINGLYGHQVLTLDIYGKVDEGYKEHFEQIILGFPPYIEYKGMVEPNESVAVIKNYTALVFPTHYYTEGVPGTIIDAYMSGVPVITALWGNYKDVFIENVTGWGYSFNDYDELKKVLIRLVEHTDEFVKMKRSTLEEAEKYMPENAINKIIAKFN